MNSALQPRILPISGVIPTRNRRVPLETAFRSLAQQSMQPREIIIVDASDSDETETLCREAISGLQSHIVYRRAVAAGAIEQRNQAMAYVTQDSILFMDDDILLEAECLARLWRALNSDSSDRKSVV